MIKMVQLQLHHFYLVSTPTHQPFSVHLPFPISIYNYLTKSFVHYYELYRTLAETIKNYCMKSKALFLASAIAVGSLALVSWVGNPDTALPDFTFNDTIPGQSTGRDFDRELKSIADARVHLKKMTEQDMDKMIRDIEKSIQDIDLQKIQADAQKSMANFDHGKIEKDLQNALKDIDKELANQEIDKDLSEKRKAEIRRDLQKAREEIKREMENIKKELSIEKAKMKKDIALELENAQKEMEKAKKEIAEHKVNIKKDIQNALTDLDKAEKEVKGYQEMVYDMESAGLLSTKTTYTIEHDKGKITINGKDLSAEDYNRFKKYFDEDRIVIRKEKDHINIQKK
jgi:hypothetical protein